MKKIISLLLLGTSLTACGFEVVDTGFRGVETKLGKVQGETLEEGLYFYNPLTSNIIEMDVRTQKKDIATPVYTKDVQQASITATVNYNLDKKVVHNIYQEVGNGWDNILVPQVVEGAIKNTIGKWDAVDLIAQRDTATNAIKYAIVAGLNERGVTVTHFEIINIDFANNFEEAVEAKVVAIQRASEAENKTKQIREEGEQKIITAAAEAEAIATLGKALAQNKLLLEHEAIKKWDGRLPSYMLGNSVPFISVGGK